MALDFPASPTAGDIYSAGGKSWQYNNGTWQAYGLSVLPYGRRNRVINGGFDVWQRGGGAFTVGEGYSADQFRQANIGTTQSITRQSFTIGNPIPGYEPQYSLRSAVTTSAGAGNLALLRQPIESVRTLAGQQVTLSWWAKADANKNMAVDFEQQFGTGGSPSGGIAFGGQKFALTTSWQRFTYTVTVPSISGKTLGSTNDGYVAPNFWFDAGSNYNTRTDTLGQQSGTFDIWGVQLEPGPVATPFEYRSYGEELALCQRYYYVVTAAANDTQFTLNRYSTTGGAIMINTPVPMRGLPADPGSTVGRCVFYDTSFGVTTSSVTEMVIASETPNFSTIQVNVTHGTIAGTYVFASWDTAGSGSALVFSAEL